MLQNKVTNGGKGESNPVVWAGYIPQEMLRPFIDSTSVLALALCLIQYNIYAR